MGIFTLVEAEQAPIEKVEKAVQGVVFKEIRKQRNSTLRNNIINTPTFIGVSPKNKLIDEEDVDSSGVPSVAKENTMMAEIMYAEPETDKDGSFMSAMPIVMLDEEWVEQLNHVQLTEIIEKILSQKLTEESSDEIEVVNEDWTDYIKIKYSISKSSVTEVSATIKEVKESEDGSCDTGEIAEAAESESTAKDAEEESKDRSKKTSDTKATFTKMKDTMDGDINNFISTSPHSMSEKNRASIRNVQDILEEGMRFAGRGKAKTISPSKRLNMKAIITEASENEYIGKKQGGGKKIKIMVTCDRSGSMHGYPTEESNILIGALNNIVLENSELEVEIMLSYTGAYTKFKLPVGEAYSLDLWNLSRTGDAEYLWQNMSNNIDSMMNADINLVYTDGSICDDPIDKTYLERRDITVNGLYVSSAMGVDELKGHYKRNKMYFHHVIVRPNIQELAEEISNKIFQERSTR